MAARTAEVQVLGLNDFIRELNVAPEKMKALERTFAKIAGATVLVRARDAAYEEAGVAKKAAGDLRTGGAGIVKFGGKGYDLGAEYGSYQYRQFQRWRGNDENAGYFFWPSIREFRDESMLRLWVQEVWPAIQPAFPN